MVIRTDVLLNLRKFQACIILRQTCAKEPLGMWVMHKVSDCVAANDARTFGRSRERSRITNTSLSRAQHVSITEYHKIVRASAFNYCLMAHLVRASSLNLSTLPMLFAMTPPRSCHITPFPLCYDCCKRLCSLL